MKRRGVTFVVIVVLLAGLVSILASVAATHRVDVKARINRMERRRADAAARAAVERAIAVLAAQTGGTTTQQQDWATLGNNGADNFVVGSLSFRLKVVDAGAQVNLNTADQAQLERLPLTAEQIDSLLDWRSTGQTARALGAKDDYYHGLAVPYNTKLRALDTFDELLQIRGFTPQTMYEPQNPSSSAIVTNATSQPTLYDLATVDSVARNVGPSGQPRVNINTAPLPRLQQSGLPQNLVIQIMARRQTPFTSMAQVLALPGMNNRAAGALLDGFSVGGATTVSGRLNLNTASQDALVTLPGITSDIASQIVSRQPQGIASFADLLSVPGFNVALAQRISDRISLNSDGFLLQIEAKAGSSVAYFQVLVRTDGATPRFFRMEEAPYSDMPARWNWQDATNDVQLGHLP
ncbi:MAG: general secretion pathway protein GspK [Fimbriimonas ginsengisoli]|uniref:General secretion pathway protein GspK n=1 Tax=Fimbriimonas ginsengisoli TaxID=1005039 RepID=A0A931LSQ7_FIMGI|nr:general secretion pathway protein GspK [Fimbriimonas ginsengisoli]